MNHTQNQLGRTHEPDRLSPQPDLSAMRAAYGNIGMAGISFKDKSPVQVRIDEQTELLNELREAVNNLIDPLLPILRGDPRNQAVAGGLPAQITNSCGLEGILAVRNNEIGEAIERLHEIRQMICL